MYYSTYMGAKPAIPIMSLKDIENYKTGIIKTNPYQGLLKGKEESEFKFGKLLAYKQEMAESEIAQLKEIAAKEDTAVLHSRLEDLRRTGGIVVVNVTKLADKQISSEVLLDLNRKAEFGVKHCSTVKELFDNRGNEDMTLEALCASEGESCF